MEGQGETTRGVPPWRAREKPRGSTTMMEGRGKTTRGVPPWRAREKPRGEDKFQGKRGGSPEYGDTCSVLVLSKLKGFRMTCVKFFR
jgi:hypothetical protein